MKKVILVSVAVSLMLASCGNKAKKAETEAVVDSVATEQLVLGLKVKMDSLASEVSRLGTLPIFSAVQEGKLEVTDKEKKMPPTYLLPLDKAEGLTTAQKKANAMVIYAVEQKLAEAYGMPVDGYKPVLSKIGTDLNANALFGNMEGAYKNGEKIEPQAIMDAYKKLENKEDIQLFWRFVAAGLVENLYLLTQNVDKFMPLFTDESASEVSYRVILVSEAIKSLAEAYPEMQDLKAPLAALDVVNAIDTKQLKEQLLTLKGDIARQRMDLIQ